MSKFVNGAVAGFALLAVTACSTTHKLSQIVDENGTPVTTQAGEKLYGGANVSGNPLDPALLTVAKTPFTVTDVQNQKSTTDFVVQGAPRAKVVGDVLLDVGAAVAAPMAATALLDAAGAANKAASRIPVRKNGHWFTPNFK